MKHKVSLFLEKQRREEGGREKGRWRGRVREEEQEEEMVEEQREDGPWCLERALSHNRVPSLAAAWGLPRPTHLGSAVHSFPRAMPAFSCTAVFCASPPASLSKTCTMSVVSRDEATSGTSMQFPRQRAALPTRISSSEPSSCIRTLSSAGRRTHRWLALPHCRGGGGGPHREVAVDGHVTHSAHPN